jgi:2'-5' RNA ligase
MYAIISELDPESAVTVKTLWGELRDACGLEAIYSLPTPHLTWFASEGLDVPAVKAILADVAAGRSGLTTYVFGLGIFSGERPVFYLPMVKSQEMIDLHNLLWEKVNPHARQPNIYYSPPYWLPHITLALNDVTRENLACALESVAFEPVEMVVSAENLIVVAQEDDPATMGLHQFRFS